MAKADFPLNINRRRLLVSSAALPVAVAASGMPCAAERLTLADVAQPPTVPTLNVSAAMARRLLEIARRNQIRQEAGLPLLPVVQELRRMKKQEDQEEFEQFEAANGRAVWNEIIKRRREAEVT